MIVSQETFKNHVFQWYDELVTRGYEIREIVGIEFTKSCRHLGKCRRLSDTKAILFFSDSLLSIFDDEDGYETCKETILHELIHAMPMSGVGHGSKFKLLAKELNFLYATTIGSHCNEATVGAFRKANLEKGKYKYHITCGCGHIDLYKARFCKVVRNPKAYHCPKCHGNLNVEYL